MLLFIDDLFSSYKGENSTPLKIAGKKSLQLNALRSIF